jgi:ATP-dependent Clp protease ATP-binding subunit ClpC
VRDVSSVRAVETPPVEDARAVGLYARFTPRARQAVTSASGIARAVPHDFVGTEHVLLGVIDEGANLALKVLAALDVEPADVRAEVIASMAPPGTATDGHLPFTPLAKHALEETAKEALGLGHNYIGCEHLLLGLLATDDGIASQVLRRMGLELRTTRRAVVTALMGVLHAGGAASITAAPIPSEDALRQILRRLDEIERRLP